MQADPLLERLKDAEKLSDQAEHDAAQARSDAAILEGWRRGFNTVQIAEYQRVPESVVANRLAQLRDAEARRA